MSTRVRHLRCSDLDNLFTLKQATTAFIKYTVYMSIAPHISGISLGQSNFFNLIYRTYALFSHQHFPPSPHNLTTIPLSLKLEGLYPIDPLLSHSVAVVGSDIQTCCSAQRGVVLHGTTVVNAVADGVRCCCNDHVRPYFVLGDDVSQTGFTFIHAGASSGRYSIMGECVLPSCCKS